MSELSPEEAFSDPRRWLGRLAPRARRAVNNALKGKAGLLCVLAVMAAAGWAYSVDWKEISYSLAAGRPDYPCDPVLLAEAKKLALDYSAVSANPTAFAGKPVLWCLVKQVGMNNPVVNGNLGWVVNMQGGAIEAVATGRMGVCKKTLAVVEKSALPGVHLAFAGHP